jgi:transposase
MWYKVGMSTRCAPVLDTAVLPGTIEECHRLIGELCQQQMALMQRLGEMEERLKLDSRNSSKPPSSDGPGAGGKRGKAPTGRRRGGQPGHKGHYRAAVAQAALDQVVNCLPPAQCACGGALEIHGEPYRHQVFELPKIEPIVTEYRCYGGRCTCCGQYQRTELPLGVPRGQLGPRALALAGTLASQFHVTQNKLPTLLAEVFGLKFSVGCVSAAHGKVAEALAPAMDELHQALLQAPVKHMDETSHQSHGHLMWNWTLATAWGATFHIEPSRGKRVAQDILGKTPEGVLVSDRYAAYQWVDAAQRQLCWAHLLRDFRRISQRAGLPGVLGRSLLRMAELVFHYHHRQVDCDGYRPLQARMQRVLRRAAEQSRCSRTANTCANLLKLWQALWHFTRDPTVPPTNNLAERALRGVVVRRKISYVTRSGRGMRFVERAYGAVHTCRQQGKSVFDFFCNTLTAFHNRTVSPSLVPAFARVG